MTENKTDQTIDENETAVAANETDKKKRPSILDVGRPDKAPQAAPQGQAGTSFEINTRELEKYTPEELAAMTLEERSAAMRKDHPSGKNITPLDGQGTPAAGAGAAPGAAQAQGAAPGRRPFNPGLSKPADTLYENKFRQRGVYIRSDLDARLTAEQEITGKGTVSRIVNEALEAFFEDKDKKAAKAAAKEAEAAKSVNAENKS